MLYHKVSFPGKNIGMNSHSLLQGIFLTQGLNPGLLHCRQIPYCLSHQGSHIQALLLLLLLIRFICVLLCATPETAAHQAPPSLGFSRQEYWSGVPLPSPTFKLHTYLNIHLCYTHTYINISIHHFVNCFFMYLLI